ncbi:MAG: hypothetical protein IJV43_06480 [Oscillospiraceae bacterium]|nr:hypothetical protein [Oscillospiraceae bacterium]
MAEKNNEIEQEIREEIRRSKKAPQRRKKGGGRRALLLLLALAAVLGAVWYAAYRDLNSLDSLRRLFTYNKVRQDADGKAELFHYDSDRSAAYAALGDGLLIVSTTRIRLLDGDGEELWAQTVNFAHPAIASGTQLAAVYDVGGEELYILGTRGLVRDMSGESGNGLLSATLNASDYLALTTLKSGYRAAVTVYTPSGEPAFAFNSSERYVSDARVLNDNRHVAAVMLGEADGVFASTLTFYAFDSEEPVSETTLGGSMVLSLGSVGQKLAALEDGRLTLFNADGSLSGSRRYEYPYLRGQSMSGADFAALLLSRYKSGSALRLVTVDAEGETLGTLDERREILDVSAAGRYVAALYSDSLTIYTADLTEYATLSGTDFAKQVVMRADGTALLLGASRAWLYIP